MLFSVASQAGSFVHIFKPHSMLHVCTRFFSVLKAANGKWMFSVLLLVLPFSYAKGLRVIPTIILFLIFSRVTVSAEHPGAGFFLPDSVVEMTLKYREVRGLIALPFVINDSIEVNLILDTGSRNLMLFGKGFEGAFEIKKGRRIQFSGLGGGPSVSGSLSIGNNVRMNELSGKQIPVVIVEGDNLFRRRDDIDGIIGYGIFIKFEIEVNPGMKTVTFRPALKTSTPPGFTSVPLRIVDSKPVIKSELILNRELRSFDLMIDTGSCLGLLLKTTNIAEFDLYGSEEVLGMGLGGPLSGFEVKSDKLILPGLELERVPTGIILSRKHNNASLGMDALEDYIFILNYCKAYACFKRDDT